jgi:phosphatidylserine/phosphatidylglycerophosphate/cardiolipin synthase-like enzyme
LTGREHYDLLVDRRIRQAAVSLWIATANVKALHLEAPVGTRARARGRYVSIVELFVELADRGVEVRLLHGAPPSRPFAEALERRGALERRRFEMRLCPRVHLKMIAVDGTHLYLGSANLTGAGLGAKGDRRRNFEAGIATEDDLLLDRMQAHFDEIWRGAHCGTCGVRKHCATPLDRRPR